MKLFLAALLLIGAGAQAQVTETATYFIPSYSALQMSPRLMGLFIQLDPDGRFNTIEDTGYEPVSCSGTYELSNLELTMTVEICGPMAVDREGNIMVAGGQTNPKVKVVQKVVVPNIFLNFPLTMPDTGFSSEMTVTTIVTGEVNRENSRKGEIFGQKGNFLTFMKYLYPEEYAQAEAEHRAAQEAEAAAAAQNAAP